VWRRRLSRKLAIASFVGGCEGGREAGLLGVAGAASSGEGVSWSDSSSGRKGKDFAGMRGVRSVESASVSDSCVVEEELGRVDNATFRCRLGAVT
jgi:hypothetical protein